MIKQNTWLLRIRAVWDPSVLLLIIPALIVVFFVDSAMAYTLLEWIAFAPVVVGLSVLISQIVFYQIRFGELVHKVRYENSIAAAMVISALILFTAILSYAIVSWVRT